MLTFAHWFVSNCSKQLDGAAIAFGHTDQVFSRYSHNRFVKFVSIPAFVDTDAVTCRYKPRE